MANALKNHNNNLYNIYIYNEDTINNANNKNLHGLSSDFHPQLLNKN